MVKKYSVIGMFIYIFNSYHFSWVTFEAKTSETLPAAIRDIKQLMILCAPTFVRSQNFYFRIRFNIDMNNWIVHLNP